MKADSFYFDYDLIHNCVICVFNDSSRWNIPLSVFKGLDLKSVSDAFISPNLKLLIDNNFNMENFNKLIL